MAIHTYICSMGQYHIGEVIKTFVETSRHKNGIKSVQIENVWETLMGPTIARYTEKIEIFNKKLFITTYVGPLKNELHYQKDTILERINEAMGAGTVNEVVIR